jgi:hypothetical protein
MNMLERLIAEEERRMLVRKLELDAQEAAIKQRLRELAEQRAAILAAIDKPE